MEKSFQLEAEGKLRCNVTLPRSRCSQESTSGTTYPLEAEGNCGEAACFPPAGRDAAAGDRLTLTPFGSPSVGKIFPTEAEGKLPRSRCSLESIDGKTGKG
ncbi:MAG: hypothetical protein LBQ54_07045 [Planctomycetaceae bacterium]|nr:hypothetical protein [Planctomycetaceae bacterium]